MLRWIGRVVGALLLVIVIAIVVLVIRFQLWRSDMTRELAADSSVVETSRGPIEYAQIGEGRPVLFVHGAPGGYDELGAFKITHEELSGFRLIIPSRPGYLRTPLSVGKTPAEQADALLALLDKLEVQRVALVGHSGGGPVALQFALRHPDRCSALVLESALVRNYAGPPAVLPKSAFGGWLRDLVLYVAARPGTQHYQSANPDDPKVGALVEASIKGVSMYSLRKAGVENENSRSVSQRFVKTSTLRALPSAAR
jgi:pimeloyl-ACP methyl ester carboxylesterase